MRRYILIIAQYLVFVHLKNLLQCDCHTTSYCRCEARLRARFALSGKCDTMLLCGVLFRVDALHKIISLIPQNARLSPAGVLRMEAQMAKSRLEDRFTRIITEARLPWPSAEHRFHPTRRWRFDFAWPDHMVAVELEGGVWTGGRHTRASGFVADCDKYNAAALLGWRVLRYTTSHLKHEQAVVMQIRAILQIGAPNA